MKSAEYNHNSTGSPGGLSSYKGMFLRVHSSPGRSIFFLLLLLLPILLLVRSSVAQEATDNGVENLGLPNWSGDDYAPWVSPDGSYLVFQSDRPGSMEDNNLWITINRTATDRSSGGQWTVPVPFRLPFPGLPSRTMQVTAPLTDEGAGVPRGSFTVNTDGFEGMASLLVRNNHPVEIYFTSVRGGETGRDGFSGLNIYFSRYRDQRWSKPEHLNTINSEFNDRMPVISPDGKRLYFSSDRPGGYGGYDIWFSERNLKTGLWSRPMNMGSGINTRFNEIAPGLSPSGQTLFFSSDHPGGLGQYDIYYTRFDGYAWGTPANLGAPYNSDRDDECLTMTDDGMWAYFSSDRIDENARGGYDLYRFVPPPWLREPVRVLFTGMVLDGGTRLPLGVEATIKILYEKETLVATSRVFHREPENGIVDNFAVTLDSMREYRVEVSAPGFYPQELVLDYKGNLPPDRIDRRTIILEPVHPENGAGEETEIRMLPGRVVDAKTQLSLPGSQVQFSMDGSPLSPVSVDREGRFLIQVRHNRPFTVTASAPGYETGRLELVERSDLKEVLLSLRRTGAEESCPGDVPECIDNLRIYFDSNSAVVSQKERRKLAMAARILKKFPELRVEVQGHTDRSYRGPEKNAYNYNLGLSTARADAVMDGLVHLGVARNRMEPHGYSYLKPRVQPKTQAERALNRRVEFRVLRSGKKKQEASDSQKSADGDKKIRPIKKADR